MNNDFNPNTTNTMKDNRKFPNSGLTAGVESGLSMVEALPRGEIQAQQKFDSLNQRKPFVEEAAGSKNGKNFTFCS